MKPERAVSSKAIGYHVLSKNQIAPGSLVKRTNNGIQIQRNAPRRDKFFPMGSLAPASGTSPMPSPISWPPSGQWYDTCSVLS